MADLMMFAKQDRPCVTLVTRDGPYILEALLREDGSIAFYHLIAPQPCDLLPMFWADNPTCPNAYDSETDSWDSDAAFAMVDLWIAARER